MAISFGKFALLATLTTKIMYLDVSLHSVSLFPLYSNDFYVNFDIDSNSPYWFVLFFQITESFHCMVVMQLFV